jgi:hypothetical protein
MSTHLECPSHEQLDRLADGLADARASDAFALHLEQCAACAGGIERLPRVVHFAAALRRGLRASSGYAPSEWEELRRRAFEISTLDGAAASSTWPIATPSDSGSFLAPPQQADEIGRLGPYRVLEPLGSGGMGMVYLAEDTVLNRQVALKVMKPSLAAEPTARQRFLREARAAAAVRHDNVVTIYQAGEAGQTAFLAMEFLHGETLDERLRREANLPVSEVVRIGRQIAQALAAAHARGLIHRDIKPGNVWLESSHHAPRDEMREEAGRAKL